LSPVVSVEGVAVFALVPVLAFLLALEEVESKDALSSIQGYTY